MARLTIILLNKILTIPKNKPLHFENALRAKDVSVFGTVSDTLAWQHPA